ncbi:TonB-dependent receptor domain-containing protein [Rubrolithibacter danxiaensis]|uniref:TonB-dependent receptor domain-containing protein n=1 Tax=Rubrolithibacter danxiaensis TaxID=3390805 RepID=UPI003BF8FD30
MKSLNRYFKPVLLLFSITGVLIPGILVAQVTDSAASKTDITNEISDTLNHNSLNGSNTSPVKDSITIKPELNNPQRTNAPTAPVVKNTGKASQGTVSGKVVDASTAKGIEFASVALINNATKKTVKGAQTDLNGNFNLENISAGSYTLRISFVGYNPYTKAINTTTGKSFALGTIKLSTSGANVLKAVVVEGKRPAIELGIDRKIFNVEQSLVSEGGSATDLLSNIPSVSVDPDGNVGLRGTNNVRILIDGKPSAMAGSNIAQVLQSIPASSIQNIELITNPSSKYDPEGQSGIINIVLKKNQKIGLNGAVSATLGSQDNYNASTNLSYRNNKWNIFGSYSFRNGNRLGGGFNNTRYFTRDSSINNNSESQRKDISNTAKAGVEFFPNENTTIGLSGNISVRDNDRNETLNYEYFKLINPTGGSLRTSQQDETDNGYDLNLYYNQKLKRKGEELSGNLSFGQSKEDGIQNLNQNFFSYNNLNPDPNNGRINDTYEKGKNINIQLDYTLPVNKNVKFETGYRTTIRNNDESQISDTLDVLTSQFHRDLRLTNDFHLEDIVHALYLNYQQQITKNFGFQLGARAEKAYLNTDFTGVDTAFNSYTQTGRLNYFRIYPSVYLTQKLGDNQLQLSYSRRVNRPRGWQVNPFLDISDPNNYRQGNPNLKPEDINSFELSYMKNWKRNTLTSSVYYRNVNDVIEPLIDTTAGVATLTRFYNLSRNQATGVEFIYRNELSNAVDLTANVNLYYNKFSGSPENNIASTDGFNWNTNLTSNFKFSNTFSGQLRMDYRAPQVRAQGRSKEMYGMDAALRKDFLNRKASISLNVRNLLNSRKWGGTTETNFFIQEFERQWQKRIFNLTFSYRFGKQDFQRTKRNNNREGEQQQPDQPEEGMF